jgi:hypothetical protein
VGENSPLKADTQKNKKQISDKPNNFLSSHTMVTIIKTKYLTETV